MFLYLWLATQIIVEMMPISSSAHLAIVERWFGNRWHKKDEDAYYFFHLPTLIVIGLYFWHQWWHLLFGAGINYRMILWVMVADSVALLGYIFVKKYVAKVPMIIGLLLTIFFIFGSQLLAQDKAVDFCYFSNALILGVAQTIAFVPGVSRLAITVFAGCCLGFSVMDAFMLSWLIQVPLMAAAAGVSGIRLYKSGKLAQLLNLPTCLSMLVSGVVSWWVLLGVIQLLILQKWWVFGVYMIVLIIMLMISKKKSFDMSSLR